MNLRDLWGCDLSTWASLLLLPGLGIALLFLIGCAVSRFVPAHQARLALWRAVLLSFLFLPFLEESGLSGSLYALATNASHRLRITAEILPESKAPGAIAVGLKSSSTGSPIEAGPGKDNGGVIWPGVIWAAGFAFLILRSAAVRLWLVLRKKRMAAADPEMEALVASLATRLRMPMPAVRAWPELMTPAAFGCWRGTIALPASFSERFSVLQQRAMLAHELAHLEQRDPFWILFSEILCALFWWHPAAWLTRRKMLFTSELAADQASTLIDGGAPALAEALVFLGRQLSANTNMNARRHSFMLASTGFRSDLARRVSLLVLGPARWRNMQRVSGITASFGGLLVAGVISALLPGPALPISAARAEVGASANAATFDQNAPVQPSASISPKNPLATQVFRSTTAANPSSPSATNGGVFSITGMLGDPQFAQVLSIQDGKPVGLANMLLGSTNHPALTAAATPPDSSATNGPVLSVTDILGDPQFRQVVSALDGKPVSSPVKVTVDSMNGAAAAPAPSTSAKASVPLISLLVQVVEIADSDGDLGLDWLFGPDAAEKDSVSTGIPGEPLPGNKPLRGTDISVQNCESKGQAAVISPAQYAALKNRLRQRPGVDILTTPRVTTASGRQARVSIQDVQTIVTGQNPNGNGPLTDDIWLGDIIDVTPAFDGGKWKIQISAPLTEFLGYAPELASAHDADAERPNGKGSKHLARFRVRTAVASGLAAPGQTMAVRGPEVTETTGTKRGFFRRAEQKEIKKRLYIFVTLGDKT
jgi:Zn-dependent protease with chaperone function